MKHILSAKFHAPHPQGQIQILLQTVLAEDPQTRSSQLHDFGRKLRRRLTLHHIPLNDVTFTTWTKD